MEKAKYSRELQGREELKVLMALWDRDAQVIIPDLMG